MREIFGSPQETCKTIKEYRDLVIQSLRELKERNPGARVFFVSGIVTSNGPTHIDRNLKTLSDYVDTIKSDGRFGPFVFSTPDVFNCPLFEKLDNAGCVNRDYLSFWRDLLRSRLIDGIIMTPRWQKSSGASYELMTARQIRLNVFSAYLENGRAIIRVMLRNNPSMIPAGFAA